MFRRPKITPIIEQVQAYQPPTPMPAVGETTSPQPGDLLVAAILDGHYTRLMDAAKIIRSALPASMREGEGRYPCMNELYGALGLLQREIARLRGERYGR